MFNDHIHNEYGALECASEAVRSATALSATDAEAHSAHAPMSVEPHSSIVKRKEA